MTSQTTLKAGRSYVSVTGRLYKVLAVNSSYALVTTGGDETEISPQSELTEISEKQVVAAQHNEAARRAARRVAAKEEKAALEGKQPGRSTTMTKKVFDKYSGVAFCRWLGTIGATKEQALYVADKLGLEISQSSVTTGLSDGRSEKYSKLLKIPTLTKAEETKVRAMMKKAPKPQPKVKAATKKAPAKKAAAKRKAPAKKAAPARKPITKASQTAKPKRTRKTKAAS